MNPKRLCCPVCNAHFRKTVTCSRCGADLTVLMTLVARASSFREAARLFIVKDDILSALNLVIRAQQLHATENGRKLQLLISWLWNLSTEQPAAKG